MNAFLAQLYNIYEALDVEGQSMDVDNGPCTPEVLPRSERISNWTVNEAMTHLVGSRSQQVIKKICPITFTVKMERRLELLRGEKFQDL